MRALPGSLRAALEGALLSTVMSVVTACGSTPPCATPAATPTGNGLTPEDISFYVLARWSDFSGCWEYKPSAKTASATVGIAVSEAGKVQRTELIRSSFDDPAADRCFEERMSRMTFPPRPTPTTVRVKLVFDETHGYVPGVAPTWSSSRTDGK